MPEGQEVETEKLHEAIHEELQKEGGGFLRAVALSTALLAALAAIASLYAGGTVKRGLEARDSGHPAPGRGLRPVGLLPGQGREGGGDRGDRRRLGRRG